MANPIEYFDASALGSEDACLTFHVLTSHGFTSLVAAHAALAADDVVSVGDQRYDVVLRVAFRFAKGFQELIEAGCNSGAEEKVAGSR